MLGGEKNVDGIAKDAILPNVFNPVRTRASLSAVISANVVLFNYSSGSNLSLRVIVQYLQLPTARPGFASRNCGPRDLIRDTMGLVRDTPATFGAPTQAAASGQPGSGDKAHRFSDDC